MKLELSSSSVVQEFEYVKLAVNDENESIWRMPAIGAAPNSPTRKLPQFIGTGMHEIVIELMNEDDIDSELETIEVYFNRNEELLRIDDTETDSKVIYNDLARSLYEINEGVCKVSLVNRELRPQIKIIRKLLDDIENSQTLPYNYLGQELVQELICDVFEHRLLDTADTRTIQMLHVRHVSLTNEFSVF